MSDMSSTRQCGAAAAVLDYLNDGPLLDPAAELLTLRKADIAHAAGLEFDPEADDDDDEWPSLMGVWDILDAISSAGYKLVPDPEGETALALTRLTTFEKGFVSDPATEKDRTEAIAAQMGWSGPRNQELMEAIVRDREEVSDDEE